MAPLLPPPVLRPMLPPPPPTLAVKVKRASEANEELADYRQQLVASALRCEPGEWQDGFMLTSLSTLVLNLFFGEAERKCKARSFRTYIGPESDGSSADSLSADLNFDP